MSEDRTPRVIYVAEAGEYSDYSVICAFESMDDAVRANVGDGIVEMVLYPTGVQPVETHLGWEMWARVYSDGRAEYLPAPRRRFHHDYDRGQPVLMPERPDVDVRDMRSYSSWGCWTVAVRGRDHEAVQKALSDRVAHLRAEALEL